MHTAKRRNSVAFIAVATLVMRSPNARQGQSLELVGFDGTYRALPEKLPICDQNAVDSVWSLIGIDHLAIYNSCLGRFAAYYFA